MILTKHMSRWLWAACLFCLTLPLQAAPLNLNPSEPDVFADFVVDYTYTGGGSGGVLSIDHVDIGGFGILFYTDSSLGLSNSGFFGTYDLNALFDDAGNFVSGDLTVTTNDAIAGVTAGADTILTGTLTNFGFSGIDDAGVLEFEFTPTGGVWGTYDWGGVIAGVTIDGGTAPTGDWDLDPDTFTQSWSSTNANGDTFVPIPGAVWLFASGFMALAGLSRRHREA